MELLSEYYSENGQKRAKIFRNEKDFVVLVGDNLTSYLSEEEAENYAEDWVLKNE
jgi:hypothetical protein